MAKPSLTTSMKDFLEKMLEVGLGTMQQTREAGKKLLDDLAAKGAAKKEEGGKLVTELAEKGQQQKRQLEEYLSGLVERALARADLARRSELAKLEARVKELEQRLG
jgi:polyhydroxyalkanoate synthesis regulator phasin